MWSSPLFTHHCLGHRCDEHSQHQGMGVLERTREMMNRRHKKRDLVVLDFTLVSRLGFSSSSLHAAMSPKEILTESVLPRTYHEFGDTNGRRE
jgi:hypothetical protein